MKGGRGSASAGMAGGPPTMLSMTKESGKRVPTLGQVRRPTYIHTYMHI